MQRNTCLDLDNHWHFLEMLRYSAVRTDVEFILMQVVKVTVLAFNPETKRLQLSLALKKDQATPETKASGSEQPGLVPGDLADAEVIGIDKDDQDTVLAYKVALYRQKELAGSGHLAATHLCDNPGAQEVLLESIQVSFIDFADTKHRAAIYAFVGCFNSM